MKTKQPSAAASAATKKCPACGSTRYVGAGPDLYKCTRCGGFFDDDPDEGGTHGLRPETRLEREERARERALSRLGRRH